MVFVLAGSISSVFVGIYLDRTHKYLIIERLMPITATFVCCSAILLLPLGNMWAASLVVMLGGIGIVPIMAVSYQLATECTHPTQPALVIGLMMCGAQTVLFVMNFAYLAVLNLNDPHPIKCLIMMGIFPLICIPISFFIKEDFRRLNCAKKNLIE
jgi:MFS family permease